MKISQRNQILMALKHKWLSPLDAFKLCGTMKLTTRISELRKKGHDIEDKWSKDKKYKLYKLKKNKKE